MGEPGRYWQPVLDHLPDLPLITYDRPGIGATPHRPPPNPPLPYSAFADELATLLDERDVTGPAVIVGHSIGSLIARVYAARHPHRVAGIVHVDGSIPSSTWCRGPKRRRTGRTGTPTRPPSTS